MRIVCAEDGIVVVHLNAWNAKAHSFETQQFPGTVREYLLRLPRGPIKDTRHFPKQLEGKFGFAISGLTTSVLFEDGGENIWRSPWKTIRAVSYRGLDTSRWDDTEQARATAQSDILSAVAARALHLRETPGSTTVGKVEVADNLDSLVEDFRELLDSNPKEEVVQGYLTENPAILLVASAGTNVYPKVPLGTEHVTDFVLKQTEHEYIVVEIERPEHPLFTKKGDPSAPLTHAERQVRDWRQWILGNNAYIEKKYPGINDPDGWVIIGRRRGMSEAEEAALARHNKASSRTTVLTYDHLLDAVERQIENFRSLSRG